MTVFLVCLAVWVACGALSYFWLKSMQETVTYFSDEECGFVEVYRPPTAEMIRGRLWCTLLGPIGLVLLILIESDV